MKDGDHNAVVFRRSYIIVNSEQNLNVFSDAAYFGRADEGEGNRRGRDGFDERFAVKTVELAAETVALDLHVDEAQAVFFAGHLRCQ